MKIELGATVRDKVTGFEGIVTGRCDYITGISQVLIQPRVKENGDWVESKWLDESRVFTDTTPLLALP